jgi:class 3 adenylate cyclase
MTCAGCGWETQAGARFCAGCGASVAPSCSACGAESQPGARFCAACGASLAAPAPAPEPAATRKVVTIVFADLIGSTALHERLDPESVSRVMARYHEAVRGPIEVHGGTVVQRLGDGVMCAFGVPRAGEDDALRAVRAGVEVQRSFRTFLGAHPELAGRIGLRVAVNTGEVVVSDDYTAGIGDPLNVAGRLQQEAKDGDVLLGESTQQLVATQVTLARVGSFALKGRAEPVTAYRVVSLERPAGAAATPYVGRDEELARLAAVFEAAAGAPAARLAVVFGSPGLGKSRLLAELGRRLEGRARVLAAHCNAAGGATFAPLADALRAHFAPEPGAGDDALRAALDALVPARDTAERAQLAVGLDALLRGTPAQPEEIFFVIRRILAALAAEAPVVLAIDDLQWAEPLLLDFTEHLVQWGAGMPLLVLAAARPELRETRASFALPGRLVSEVVMLGGLDAGAAMRLAANVIGAETLPAAVAGRVLTTSEGNPLFVGELVRMLVNDGALQKQGERWTLAVDVATLDMPPTIQALLAARIERLRPEERLVLERAAVIGRQFSRAAVTELLPREAHAELPARLEALRRSELIEPDPGWLFGEPALRFHHGLIRDAAYRRVLRGTRADLHARFADWLAARASEAAPQDDLIGWHLEQAHLHLREIGPLDPAGLALGERAARHLGAAGGRALARDDLEPAASLLGRALACLGAAHPDRAGLARDWCEALLAAGEVGPAGAALAELEQAAAGAEPLRAWYACFRAELAVLTDPQALRRSADAAAAAAGVLAAAGDAAGEAKAHSVHALALSRLGKIGTCEVALDHALAAARRAGDRRRANAVLAGAPLAALFGPSPVTRASGRCLDVVRVLRITQGAPAVEAVALSCQALLETLRGRSEAGRRMIASARRMVEALGNTRRVLEADVFAGRIALLEGDARAAEGALRAAYEGLRTQGLGSDAAQAAALLGRALLADGRAAEAEALSHESEALAGDDFAAAIAWRGVRAEALARRGEHAAALELARAAVEIAAATDDLLDHADARSALAAALRAAGRAAEADAEAARALALWEQKGATLLVERARSAAAPAAVLESASAPRAAPAPPTRRRIRRNAALANVDAVAAAVSARDAGAFLALTAEGAVQVDHSTGSELDRAGMIRSWTSFLDAKDFALTLEPLATLGPLLALHRRAVSASGVVRGGVEVGAYERGQINVVEVDAEGRRVRTECFSMHNLGDAVARLYERYAELLPESPERRRAAATARSVAALSGPVDVDRYAEAFAPDVELLDRRTLGTLSGRGAEAVREQIRAWREVADDSVIRVADVRALRPDALLARLQNTGISRASGGAYERPSFALWVFGAEGCVTRIELFDPDREAEALARFDALATAEPPAPRRRIVPPNAATAIAARVEAAIAARDLAAVEAAHAAELEAVDRPSTGTFDRTAMVATLRMLLAARDPVFRMAPLASLGERLALFHTRVSTSGLRSGDLDVGAYEIERVTLLEADASGRVRWNEGFGVEHLGDAIAALYERYAALQPEGVERERAAATARTVAVYVAQVPSLEGYLPTAAPGIEFVDHRALVTLPPVGPEDWGRNLAIWFEASEEVTHSADDVLALRADGLVVLQHERGRDRATGGLYDTQRLMLWGFDAAGLLLHTEMFDLDQTAEALARFEALAAPAAARAVPRRVRPNAATAAAACIEAAIAAGDAGGLGAFFADGFEAVDGPMRLRHGREEMLQQFRMLLSAEGPALRYEPIASLGDGLALFRAAFSARAVRGGELDVGGYEHVTLQLYEVDAAGRMVRDEGFTLAQLGEAIVRLYERYAERMPKGPGQQSARLTSRLIAGLQNPPDPASWGPGLAPAIELVDHRLLGLGAVRGVDAVLASTRALFDLSETRPTTRFDEVLGTAPSALLLRGTNSGTDRATGGAYERQHLLLLEFGAGGRLARVQQLDSDREAEALARFDALVAPVARRVRQNAATANAARLEAAIAARDADAVGDCYADGYESADHAMGGLPTDRAQQLRQFRMLLAARQPLAHHEPLATIGESLVLLRASYSASGFRGGELDVGAYERPSLAVNEVDAAGRMRWSESFAPDRLGEAVRRLYVRHAEQLPAGPVRDVAAARARAFATQLVRVPPEGYADTLAPEVEVVDHRVLGTWAARGAEAMLEHYQSLARLGDDIELAIEDVLRLEPAALLVRGQGRGTDRSGGGAFETTPMLALVLTGSAGRITRMEYFDADRDADAVARFDALSADAAPRENAATRWTRRIQLAFEARDWDGVAALLAPGFRQSDRRRTARVEMDRAEYLAGLRWLFDVAAPRYTNELLATRGERLALYRAWLQGAGPDVGPFESELLALVEFGEQGQQVGSATFDPDDLAAAYAELEARYAASAPHDLHAPVEANAATAAYDREQAAFEARDWAAMRAVFAPHARIDDRRSLVGIPVDPDQLVADKAGFAEAEGARYERQLLATFGDRIDLERGVASGGPVGARFEIEVLTITEVDEAGKIVLRVTFDADGRRAAQREALARLVAREPAASVGLAPLAAFLDAYGDPSRMRSWLADDVVSEDRRLTGAGTFEGADAYLASLAPAPGLEGPVRIELLSVPAVERHGAVVTARAVGRATGGGDFEVPFAAVSSAAAGRINRLEIFEIDRLAAALARLAELRPDPAQIPPNAATRVRQRWHEAVVAGDTDALEPLFAPTLVFEDRTRRSLVRGDRETLLANDRLVSASRPHGSPRLVGTAGDRLALHHLAITGTTQGVEFEAEWLDLVEVDASGQLVAVIVFDLDDRAAAFAEAEARFAAGEGAAAGGQALFLPLNLALARRDWEALRACCAEELVVHDHRTLGLGSLARDTWIESVAAATGIASEWSGESCRILAFGRHGRVIVTRAFGTMPDGGGPFENLFVSVLCTDGAVVRQLEMFDIGDAERALARFEELRAGMV